jgi:N-methylhydantoinase A/oxoprolinase/acetone carboxylase beta subunit
MLVADQVYDAQQAVLVNLDRIQGGAVASRLSELEAELHGRLTGFDVDVDAVRISRRAECRYLGQAEGLTLDLGGLPSDPHAWAPVLKSRFEDEHRRHWNFIQPDRPIELINLRLRAVVPAQPVDQEGAQSRNGGPPTRVGERGVHLSGGPCNMGVFDRRALSPGDHLTGPCIVQEESSCLVVSEDWALDVHPSLALILKRIG